MNEARLPLSQIVNLTDPNIATWIGSHTNAALEYHA